MISSLFILALDISYCVCVFIYRMTQARSFGASIQYSTNRQITNSDLTAKHTCSTALVLLSMYRCGTPFPSTVVRGE